jgi:hypothetical protein
MKKRPFFEASSVDHPEHGHLRTRSEWSAAEFSGVKGKSHQRQYQELLGALSRNPDGSYAAPSRGVLKSGTARFILGLNGWWWWLRSALPTRAS